MDQEITNAIETRAAITEQKIAVEMKAGFETFQAQFSATYNKDAHKFRDWVTANPLPAARVVGSVCLIVGAAIMYVVLKCL